MKRSMNRSLAMVCVVAAGAIFGCTSERPKVADLPATMPVRTASDAQLADPEWWLQLDALGVDRVTGGDFDRLWANAERVSRDYLFTIDRRDRRLGLLTTQPNVSAQWFEPWRRELRTGDDIAASSIATHRRTIYFNFDKSGDRYTVTPKVLVERQSLEERRVTGILIKGYLRRNSTDDISGTRESDAGVLLPGSYWYPVGRDYALEQKLVADLNASLK